MQTGRHERRDVSVPDPHAPQSAARVPKFTCNVHSCACAYSFTLLSYSPALVEAERPVGRQRGAAHQCRQLAHDIQGARPHENVLQGIVEHGWLSGHAVT